MTAYGIGMDTGGTYTDAVIMDLDRKKVLAFAKTPTIHKDLGLSLEKALEILKSKVDFKAESIEKVVISSTLATNSIVEGRGADVGLFVIGIEKHFELPVAGIKHLKGGHNVLGEEEAELDIEALLDGLLFFKGKVDAYAVISSMSFANPDHEKVAAKAISLVDPKPVFCSYETSNRPGFEARAATSVLNARLMSFMQDFLYGVLNSLKKYGLEKKLYVICGDGSSADVESAIKKSVSTVASGPAATAFFGLAATGLKDALVIDVGGTTSDISLIRDSKLVIDSDGSRIANLETHVSSVLMHTIGLGGDSFARVERGKILLGPERVLPLCMAEGIASPEDWMDADFNTFCLRAASEKEVADPLFLVLSDYGPMASGQLCEALAFDEIVLKDRMSQGLSRGYIEAVGFTPTDALHVLGRLELGDKKASFAAARILGEALGLDAEAFCLKLLDESTRLIEDALIDFMVRDQISRDFSSFWPKYRSNEFIKLNFSLKIPIVGIGAAARYLLPSVAEALGCELVLAENYQIGNAVGALLMA